MISVLVTGATGFIGNHVIQYLLKKDVEIKATSRDAIKASKQEWYKQVHFFPFEIGQPFNEESKIFFKDIDVCIHLAWEELSNFKSNKHLQIIPEKHLLFLKILLELNVKKITAIGTCLEYGLKEGELNEEIIAAPSVAYGIGKNQLRINLEDLKNKYDFQLDWIRLFYMYGSGQSSKALLSQLKKAIEDNEVIFNMSAGQQERDYLAIETIAKNIVELALLKSGNGIINCSSGKPIKILNLVEEFITLQRSDIKLNLGYYNYPDYEPMSFWGDNKKMNRLIYDYKA